MAEAQEMSRLACVIKKISNYAELQTFTCRQSIYLARKDASKPNREIH